MTTPGWLPLVLLTLATFRLTRLVAYDDLTVKPRRWLTGVSDDEHALLAEHVDVMVGSDLDPWSETSQGAMPIGPARFYLSRMIRCPWCLGWWLSLAAWLAWEAWPHAVTIASVPLALSALVGLVAKTLDS